MSTVLFIVLSHLSYYIVCCTYLSVLITEVCYCCFDFVVIAFNFISSFIMSVLNLICILMLFLISDVSDAFYFNEINIMLFLNYFKLLDKNYYINDSDLIKKLSDYCELKIQEEIRTLAEYDQQD